MVVPAVLVLLLLTIYPFVYLLYVSSHIWPISPTLPRIFLGFGQFTYLFQDPTFIESLSVTVKLMVVGVTIQISLGTLLAILLLIVGIAIAYDTFFAEKIINGATKAASSDLNFFSQFIIDFSKEMPFFYGLFTIMFAIILGVGAAFVRRFISNFRKKLLVKS